MQPADLLDKLIEAPVVPSFTRIGFEARRRAEGWTSLDEYELRGRVILITGGSSGLGKAAAHQLASCGAELILVGRSAEKNERVVAELVEATGNVELSQFVADMGDLDQVRSLASHVLAHHPGLDTVVHNAGALLSTRHVVADGTEATVASQVIGPFLLTQLLLERLRSNSPARVITMSSGGMYSAALSVTGLEMGEDEYRGTEQYARAKRAQVVLTQIWAERFGSTGVYFHSLHPGWADTPGVADSLPGFQRVMGPLLRDSAAGADTMVWLVVDDHALQSNGVFWHDRRPRSAHKIPTTRKAETEDRRSRLWDYVAAKVEVATR